jgi:DNA-binding IclR family transcriptional regulator
VNASEKRTYLIQTVCHALDLLDQFNGDRSEIGVTELSRRMALNKNNVFRLLATLESRHFVERNIVTGEYRLGLKNLEMGQTFSRHLGLKLQARPVLEALTATLRETSCLTVIKGNCIICLDAVETPLPVRVVTRLGAWLPTYCSAAGKVHLAYMNTAERSKHLPAVLQRMTPKTIVSRQELDEELARVRVLGYALDDEELDEGVRCVSVPIRDCTQQVFATLSVCGPTVRITDERLRSEIVRELQQRSWELTGKLGKSQERTFDRNRH